MGGFARRQSEDEKDENDDYREERRETGLIKFDAKGARAALRFCTRAKRAKREAATYSLRF
jgi:hypothetical protein